MAIVIDGSKNATTELTPRPTSHPHADLARRSCNGCTIVMDKKDATAGPCGTFHSIALQGVWSIGANRFQLKAFQARV